MSRMPSTNHGGWRIGAEEAAGGALQVFAGAIETRTGGRGDNSAVQNHLTPDDSGVRRLMPVECERLQGFPDGWTDIPWAGKPHAPDSRRYAALGDAVTVPVARWIGERLMRFHNEGD